MIDWFEKLTTFGHYRICERFPEHGTEICKTGLGGGPVLVICIGVLVLLVLIFIAANARRSPR